MVAILKQTNHRRPLLQLGDYEYRFDRTSKDGSVVFFRCIEKKCRGRARYNGNVEDAVMIRAHGHSANTQKLLRREHRLALKRAAETSMNAPLEIVMAQRVNENPNLVVNGPSLAADIRTVQRIRIVPHVKSKHIDRIRETNIGFQGRDYVSSYEGTKDDFTPKQSTSTYMNFMETIVDDVNRVTKTISSHNMTLSQFQVQLVSRLSALPLKEREEARSRVENELNVLFAQNISTQVESHFDQSSRGSVMERLLAMVDL